MWVEAVSLACALAPSAYLLLSVESERAQSSLGWDLCLGAVAGVLTTLLVPVAKPYMLKRGIRGRDLGKRGTDRELLDMCVDWIRALTASAVLSRSGSSQALSFSS